MKIIIYLQEKIYMKKQIGIGKILLDKLFKML